MLCTMEAFTSPSAILRRAKDHIADEVMWWKDGYSPNGTMRGAEDGNPCCGLGAVLWADQENRYRRYISPEADLYLHHAVSRSFRSFGAFNDAPETTHADAMAAFDRAIALADADAVQRIRERV
jgi:hypothetical protein